MCDEIRNWCHFVGMCAMMLREVIRFFRPLTLRVTFTRLSVALLDFYDVLRALLLMCLT